MKFYAFESHFYINNITTLLQYVRQSTFSFFDAILIVIIYLAVRYFAVKKLGSDYHFRQSHYTYVYLYYKQT